MNRTGFDEHADHRGSAVMRRTELMCAATDCPNRWTVYREGWRPLCSAHAWQPPVLWPRITAEQVEWLEQHRRWGNALPVTRTPAPRTEPQPASQSRAWRELHGAVEDIEHDREG